MTKEELYSAQQLVLRMYNKDLDNRITVKEFELLPPTLKDMVADWAFYFKSEGGYPDSSVSRQIMSLLYITWKRIYRR